MTEATRASPEGKAQRLLVVDDSPTVLRVMEFVLAQAGYEVTCLERGSEVVEIARRLRPNLIFVDFNMPEQNGYDVCRDLGREPELDTIPIVVMSTRGDAVGDRFVREMGIVDHITKPFAPEALLAVVQHTLRKTEEIHTAAHPPQLAELGIGSEAEKEQLLPSSATRLTEAVAANISDLVQDRARLQSRLHALFDTNDLVPEMRALGRERPGAPALSGDLGQVGVAEVLQLLALQRQSGLLTVEHKASSISIAFKDGAVRLVTGENVGRELLLGRILVREKLIEARELELFLANRQGTRRRLGTQVVKLGYLSQEDLRRALERQSSELVYELLRWSGGLFEFYRLAQLPDEVLEFDFGITIDALLMEGFRRVDEWGLIESMLPSFDLVPQRITGGLEHVGPQGLTGEEQEVYEHIDGARRVHEIIERTAGGTFEVARILYRLLSARVIALRDS